ncbi:M28 family metallopeptidase [Deminuibacter soli]|uniref:Carboxypeptidase Q n=1 Tax=Deminuibacter soli TaxID=2291815 RepID=A0A3E1NLR4_9BACT|nr:M20/M25/M40 family metallo-hydrolase [Deminuibacter soli]RFM28738.1 M20/M25/M40 family metallo-hydrolase [Deminuibacter soli]
MRKMYGIALALCFYLPQQLQAQEEKVDLATIEKIKQEGLQHSQVMDIAFHLTDVSGARLTASPGFNRAGNYAVQQLTQWGLTDAKLDPWGEFGKGWELQKSYVALTAPYYRPLIAYPKAWCSGTNGAVNAQVILVTAKDSTELLQYKGKLAGKIIITERADTVKLGFKADGSRYTDEQLAKMAGAKLEPTDTAAMRRRREMFMRGNGAMRTLTLLKEMARAEGAAAILSSGAKNQDGTLFTQGGGGYKATDPENFTDVMLGAEDYNTILRLVKAGMPVKLDMDIQTKFHTADTKGYNVIAEIKGTDPKLKDEVVMLGGHLDSWHTATGATDNAAGCAVMMEALRILKTLGVHPRRTIRIGLWSGEEEGLLGSRGYVKKTFADPANMQLLPAHEKFSSYFNIDNGTGKIRGIYLQGNEACGPIFTKWLEPFHDLGATTVTVGNTGGTDHQSFDAVGLPGFQFIQDPMEYDARTHHSNMDSYDHLSPDDMKQIATIVAGFVYNAAQRDAKLPRKELPKPRPAGGMF